MTIRSSATLLLPSGILAVACFGNDGTAESSAAGRVASSCAAYGQHRVNPADLAAGDIYGAAFAVDGGVALVASEWDDDQGKDSGAVFVYRCDGEAWTQEQKLLPGNGQAGDNFGRSVELDGDVAVVGAHWDNDKGAKSGSLHVFRYDGQKWNQEQKLLAPDGRKEDRLGNTVSIDGNVIVGGAWRKGAEDTGAAYVFRREGGSWVAEQKLTAADAQPGDNFGRHVCVSGDVIAVGAWKDDGGGEDLGAVYVFRHNGTRWAQEQKLSAPDGSASDRLGWAVYLDGDVIVAGAHGDDDKGANSGSAHVWRHDGQVWAHEQKLVPGDGKAHEHFGYAIAVEGDNLVIGAPVSLSHVSGPGSIYLYRHGGDGWEQARKIVPSDGAPQDAFGFHLALGGNVVASGSWRNDDAGPDSGAAYLFTFKDL